MLWGHLEGSFAQMAVWLYRLKLRWLLMRSFPDTCTCQRIVTMTMILNMVIP